MIVECDNQYYDRIDCSSHLNYEKWLNKVKLSVTQDDVVGDHVCILLCYLCKCEKGVNDVNKILRELFWKLWGSGRGEGVVFRCQCRDRVVEFPLPPAIPGGISGDIPGVALARLFLDVVWAASFADSARAYRVAKNPFVTSYDGYIAPFTTGKAGVGGVVVEFQRSNGYCRASITGTSGPLSTIGAVIINGKYYEKDVVNFLRGVSDVLGGRLPCLTNEGMRVECSIRSRDC